MSRARRPLLSGSAAVVTGGGRGIGAAAAIALSQEGAAVAVASRTQAEIEEVAGFINDAGGHALAVPADVTSADQVDTLVDKSLAAFGRLDFLVNAAGNMEPIGGPTWEAPRETWRDTVISNIVGVFHTCHAVVPHLVAQGSGRILNMSSPAALNAIPGASAYCTTKAAVNHFSRVLASELMGTGVTANTFAIGPTDTPVFREVCRTLYPTLPESWVNAHARNPVEACRMLVWLCGPATVGITGRHLAWRDPWVRQAIAYLER